MLTRETAESQDRQENRVRRVFLVRASADLRRVICKHRIRVYSVLRFRIRNPRN